MQYRQPGKDVPKVSVLGLGAWPLSGGMGQMAMSWEGLSALSARGVNSAGR